MEEWRGERGKGGKRHTISVAAARAVNGKEGGKLRAATRSDEHYGPNRQRLAMLNSHSTSTRYSSATWKPIRVAEVGRSGLGLAVRIADRGSLSAFGQIADFDSESSAARLDLAPARPSHESSSHCPLSLLLAVAKWNR